MKHEQILTLSRLEYRKYLLLTIAALALFFSGIFAPQSMETDAKAIALITWACISGVFIVYRFNDYAFRHESPWKNAKNFLNNTTNLIVVLQFFLIGIPVSFVFITPFQFMILAFSGVLGICYAVNFKLGNYTWMAKYVIVLKNILIGTAWALLFIVGYGSFTNDIGLTLFVFIAIQVFIGSMIRDLYDYEGDQSKGLNTVPTAIGLVKTLVLLHVVNIASLLVCFMLDELWLGLFVPVVFWRMVNLIFIQTKGMDILWTQVFNLMTCVVILLSLLFLEYGIY